METLVWVPVKTLMNQSMFLCVYVSIPSVMLLVLLLGLEPVIKFIYIWSGGSRIKIISHEMVEHHNL